jgi:hypothetical protein
MKVTIIVSQSEYGLIIAMFGYLICAMLLVCQVPAWIACLPLVIAYRGMKIIYEEVWHSEIYPRGTK